MRRTTALWCIGAVAIAIAARLAYGGGALGYDALWSLRWGAELPGVPTFDAPFAPTPHPLANLVAAALEPLGADTATTVLLGASWLALGALAVAVTRLGAALFSLPAGVLAAVVLLTRPLLVVETAQAQVDLPFLALVVAAADREVRQPRTGIGVPILLAVAGLLRPEAWALGAAYAIYRHGDARRLVPVLCVAPAVWLGMDLWATGDVLHSLNGTRELGESLGRPTSGSTALTSAPAALIDVLREPLLWVALAGAGTGLLARPRESALPGALIVAGMGGFLVLGAAGLPLLGRYLLLPACMLALFVGLAVFGWRRAQGVAWRLLALAAAGVVIAGVPGDRAALGDAHSFGEQRRAIQDDLRAAVRATDARGCATVVAPDHRALALITAQRDEPGTGGRLTFAYASADIAGRYALAAYGPLTLPATEPRAFSGRFWVVSASGC